MKTFILFAALVFAIPSRAQMLPPRVSEPQYIAVDSRDNVYAALKYGIIKITPDGTVTNLTKQAGTIGEFDRPWSNLLIDSKDNLYANDGKVIYKFTLTADNKALGKVFAGLWSYKLEDGPIATAGFNLIGLMTIDKNDNIYLTDGYDKIKDAIGNNFVTDSYYLNDPAKKYEKYAARRYSVIRKISASGIVTTLKTPDGKYILPNDISGMTTDDSGNIIYTAGGFARFVGKIDLNTGTFSSIAGQPYKREWCPVYTPGDSSRAEFVEPENVITNKKGEVLITDLRLHRIIKIANGKVSTLAGNSIIDPCSQNIGGRAQEGYKDGKALTALFNFPKGMAYDSKGNLFIADMNNHCIRKLSPDGVVTTFAK
ncbi:MAG: hypothetical protein M3R52_10490 [Acidobacteriota bacterium]|nr:hypothetical protein [Acidobacteriota bacterium]